MSGAEAALRAARLGDEVGHGFGLLGMVAGAIIGAVVAAALVAATAATGGLLLVAIVGGCIAGGGLAGGALARGIQKAANIPDPTTGTLTRGSPNVTVNGKPAMRAGLDVAGACNGLYGFNHFPKPMARIAQGARTVTVNGKPMARTSMKLECGAEITTGSGNVLVGGPTATVVAIHDAEAEFQTALEVLGLVSLGAGLGAALLGGGLVGGVLFAGAAGGINLGMTGLHALGDSLGPGWGDIFTGVAGFGLLAAGPKLGEVFAKQGEVSEFESVSLPAKVKPPPDNFATYRTHGIYDDPMLSPEGRSMVYQYERQGATRGDAIKRAHSLMKTGSTLPQANPVAPGDVMYKVVPKGNMPGPGSEFWATKDQVDALHGMDFDQIGSHLGLPLESQQAGGYSVVKIQAVRPTMSFTSKIARTTQNGWSQTGEGIQTLVTDRGAFTMPVDTGVTLP